MAAAMSSDVSADAPAIILLELFLKKQWATKEFLEMKVKNWYS